MGLKSLAPEKVPSSGIKDSSRGKASEKKGGGGKGPRRDKAPCKRFDQPASRQQAGKQVIKKEPCDTCAGLENEERT
jgi:hypothetical protein